MKTYTIFIKEDKNHAVEDVLLVKEGFNIFAMIFNIFWLLYYRLWLFAFLAFSIMTLVSALFSPYVYSVFIFLFTLLIGFEANNLLIYMFQREKYTFAGYSMGADEDDAKLRFLNAINEENKEKGKIIY